MPKNQKNKKNLRKKEKMSNNAKNRNVETKALNRMKWEKYA